MVQHHAKCFNYMTDIFGAKASAPGQHPYFTIQFNTLITNTWEQQCSPRTCTQLV